MQAGLDALYQRRDPTDAVAEFRQVLAVNREHYGANYQIAVALDRAQRQQEARTYWQTVLEQAQGYGQQDIVRQARARLASADRNQVTEWMQTGLDAMYKGNDPRTAANLFRKVLEQNSTHFGATYQLAKALDMAGEREEARRLWPKVLVMAVKYRDARAAATARERLKEQR